MNVQNKKNRGNFLEMLELLASYNEQVGALVLDCHNPNFDHFILIIIIILFTENDKKK